MDDTARCWVMKMEVAATTASHHTYHTPSALRPADGCNPYVIDPPRRGRAVGYVVDPTATVDESDGATCEKLGEARRRLPLGPKTVLVSGLLSHAPSGCPRAVLATPREREATPIRVGENVEAGLVVIPSSLVSL